MNENNKEPSELYKKLKCMVEMSYEKSLDEEDKQYYDYEKM